MVLSRGRKLWSFWNPQKQSMREMVEGNLDHLPHPNLTHDVGPGDLLLVPSGWPHAVLTTEDVFGVGRNFLALDDLAGLDLSMSEEATALGFEGEERAQFMSKQKKVLARQIKLSAGELDSMQMRDHQLARAALDKESEKLSEAYQSKHAKASGRGKRNVTIVLG
jgi:ribosomal protein L16 Arg81 hydroxylase